MVSQSNVTAKRARELAIAEQIAPIAIARQIVLERKEPGWRENYFDLRRRQELLWAESNEVDERIYNHTEY